MKIVMQHDEGAKVEEYNPTGKTDAEAMNHAINRVDSSKGGYVKLFDNDGKMVRQHPELRNPSLFRTAKGK